MVKRFSIEELSQKSENIFALIKTLAERAKEIGQGATPLLLKPESKNPVTIALEEVLADKVKVKTKVQSYLEENLKG